MWWTKDKTKEESTRPRCPTCVTRPVLVQSGYGNEKSLKCPVCKVLFNSRGVKYDPDDQNKTGKNDSTIEEEVLKEQEELWESLWGK